MSDLVQLVYISSTNNKNLEWIEGVVEASASRNKVSGINGFLIYCDGNFLQFIEGKRDAVQSLYYGICGDKRHHGIKKILELPVKERLFRNNGMELYTIEYANNPYLFDQFQTLQYFLSQQISLPQNIRLSYIYDFFSLFVETLSPKTSLQAILGEDQFNKFEFSTFFYFSQQLLSIANRECFFIHLNASWEKILEYDPDELKSRPILDFVHPLDKEKTADVLASLNSSANQVSELSNRMLTKSGEIIWLEWKMQVVGNRLFTSSHDVTTLMEEKSLFDTSENVAKIGSWSFDLQSLKVHWTQEVYTMHNLPFDTEITKDLVFSFFSPEDQQKLGGGVENAIKNGEPYDFELLLRPKDQAPYWVRAMGFVKHVKGVPVKLFGVLQNINQQVIDRKALETAKGKSHEASKLKSLFLTSMSHEIRTPIHGVIGLMELMTETPLLDSQTELLGKMQSCSNSILQLINDVLDISKIEAGKMQLTPSFFSLTQMIRSIEDIFTALLKTDKIQFSIECDPELPEVIYSDPGRIKQILINLLNNAFKFTEKGSVVLTIERMGKAANQKMLLCFKVKDTGIGIPVGKLDHIFLPFEQSDSSHSSKFGGTGLGLSISRNFARILGGDLSVVSEPDNGAEFSLLLPVEVAADEAATNKKLLSQEYDFTGYEILLVEDNPTNQLLAKNYIKKTGASLVSTTNGMEAIEECEKKRFHLILMDLQMPIMGGLEATEKIRQESSFNSRTRILALTADVQESTRLKCMEIGMNGFLAKPFKKNELYTAVAEQLKAVRIEATEGIRSKDKHPSNRENSFAFSKEEQAMLSYAFVEVRTLLDLLQSEQEKPKRELQLTKLLFFIRGLGVKSAFEDCKKCLGLSKSDQLTSESIQTLINETKSTLTLLESTHLIEDDFKKAS